MHRWDWMFQWKMGMSREESGTVRGEWEKNQQQQNCRYKIPILNFISITIRNTRLYRPLQSKIWTFTIHIKKTKAAEKKKNHLGETSSILKAMHTHNRIQLLFALYIFYSTLLLGIHYEWHTYNIHTENVGLSEGEGDQREREPSERKKVTQKVLLKWNLLCSCLMLKVIPFG